MVINRLSLSFGSYWTIILSHHFVGNAGGYLGLFLGYALLNIPDFIEFLLELAKGWKSKNNVVQELSTTGSGMPDVK